MALAGVAMVTAILRERKKNYPSPPCRSQSYKASDVNEAAGEKETNNGVQTRNSISGAGSGDYSYEGEWEFVEEHPEPEEISSNQRLRREIARLLDLRITHSTILFLLVIMGISMGIQVNYNQI